MTATETIQRIKKNYPNVGEADSDAPYCVGGALRFNLRYKNEGDGCFAFVAGDGFPSNSEVASILKQYNPKLSDDRALAYAEALIECNDYSDFNGAWETAEKALNDDGTGLVTVYERQTEINSHTDI